MTEHYDGTPVQPGLEPESVSPTNEHPHFSTTGLREMVVIDVRYVDDPSNRSNSSRVEYVCRDLHTSEEFPNVQRLQDLGGLDDGDDDVLHAVQQNRPGVVSTSVDKKRSPANNTDGDRVLVGFINGARSRGVIVGAIRHPYSQYGAGRADGERRLTQHKGTKVEITKDGEYTITHKSGAYVKLLDDGSVEAVPASGKQIRLGDSDLDDLLDGLVHGRGVDPYTGASYAALGNASTVVLGKK